jgi:hypothetical protein
MGVRAFSTEAVAAAQEVATEAVKLVSVDPTKDDAKVAKAAKTPLSWRVSRTASKGLPVYTDYRGKAPLTVVRRIEGDIWVRFLFRCAHFLNAPPASHALISLVTLIFFFLPTGAP